MLVVKYWAYFAGKLAIIAAIVYALLIAVLISFPHPRPDRYGNKHELFLQNMPATFAIMMVFLIGTALFGAAIRDQRRRCRTCLRRLIMPVFSGSWGNTLTIGRPTTAWICPFGHGTLRIDELQITGKDAPDWEPHDDNIWTELESYYQAGK